MGSRGGVEPVPELVQQHGERTRPELWGSRRKTNGRRTHIVWYHFIFLKDGQ